MKHIEREFISRRKQGKTEKAKEEKRDMQKKQKKKKMFFLFSQPDKIFNDA